MMGVRCGGCRSVEGCRLVGSLCACRPAGLALDRAACRPVSFAVVWLERGESTIDPNQECPPRFPPPRKALTHDHHHRDRPSQGLPHRCRCRQQPPPTSAPVDDSRNTYPNSVPASNAARPSVRTSRCSLRVGMVWAQSIHRRSSLRLASTAARTSSTSSGRHRERISGFASIASGMAVIGEVSQSTVVEADEFSQGVRSPPTCHRRCCRQRRADRTFTAPRWGRAPRT